MALEDFTTYTEVDPLNRFTVTSHNIDVFDLSKSEDAYVYSDKGVDHFDGDYEHLEDAIIHNTTSHRSECGLWGLSNVVDELNTLLSTYDVHALSVLYETPDVRFQLYEGVSGSLYSDSFLGGSFETAYYFKIIRGESVGTYGTLYCYIYDDAERTSLVDTLSLALHEKRDFRYVYAVNSVNTGGTTRHFYADINNLDLGEAGAPALLRRGLGRGLNRGVGRGL